MDAKELCGIPKCVWAPWQNNGQLRQGHGGKVPPREEPYGDKLQADAKDKAEKRAESAAERSWDILSGDQLADYRSQELTILVEPTTPDRRRAALAKPGQNTRSCQATSPRRR